MFDLPEQYKIEKKIPLKEFIPKDLKPEIKKRIKDNLRDATLRYQIMGEEIPSVMNDEYKCPVIQIYDLWIQNIKEAAFFAKIYQSIIKPLCILRIHDTQSEVFSFAVKRLSKTDENEIVIVDMDMTEKYPVMLPDQKKDRFLSYMSYHNILNRENKVNYYNEMYTKSYMLHYEKVYANMETLVHKPIWYDTERVKKVYSIIKRIVMMKEQMIQEQSNVEKIKMNQEIAATLAEIETVI